MSISLVVDIVVAVLLVITIGYAMSLNRKLGSMRRDRGELEKLASSFSIATNKAEESINRLEKTSGLLQARIDKAQLLSDDLAFLTDRGSSAADRLEISVRTARDQAPGAVLGTIDPSGAEPRGVETRGVETRGVETRGVETRGVETRGVETRNTIEPRPAAPASDLEFGDDDGLKPRTEAERELLKALQAAR